MSVSTCPTCNTLMRYLPIDKIWKCFNILCKDFLIEKMYSDKHELGE